MGRCLFPWMTPHGVGTSRDSALIFFEKAPHPRLHRGRTGSSPVQTTTDILFPVRFDVGVNFRLVIVIEGQRVVNLSE